MIITISVIFEHQIIIHLYINEKQKIMTTNFLYFSMVIQTTYYNANPKQLHRHKTE